MKKVVELYQGILPAIGLTVGNNDQIFMGGGELGECSPVIIDNKHLYLPTDEFLKNSDLREQVAFHPLAEDTLKKRSPVLTAIQNGFNLRLYSAGAFLIEALLNACIKQKSGDAISNPRLLKYISGNEDCDEKVKTFFLNISKVIQADQSKKLFNVYLRHGNEANDGSSRQCVIASPLVHELERIASIGSSKTGGLKVWGVESPRKKDVELLANLIKTIFPGIENRSYSTGSNDKIAPYCDALFNALKPINEDIIDAAKALAKIEPVSSTIEYLCIDLTPVDNMLAMKEDYDILRNSIVKTAYNDGDGWNTQIRNPGSSDRPKTELPTHTPSRHHEEDNQRERVEDPIAITKAVIANAVKPIPGTRQPLVTGVTEEDYRTVQKPRRPTDRNAEYRGYDYPPRRESRSSVPARPHIDDFRDSRDASDALDELLRLKRDYERDRDWEAVRDVEDDIRELRKIRDRLEDEERPRRGYDRDDRDRDRGGRDRGRDDRRGSRPRPRAVEQDDRRRSRDRDREDRFGRRSR
jgi:hypothetical protein